MPGRGPSPDIWRFVREPDAAWNRERLLIVVLNGKRRIGGVAEIPLTDLTAAYLRRALKNVRLVQARGLVALHHHPNASRRPVHSDAAIARRLEQIAAEIGVPLLDHLIFRRGRFRSMAERRRR